MVFPFSIYNALREGKKLKSLIFFPEIFFRNLSFENSKGK